MLFNLDSASVKSIFQQGSRLTFGARLISAGKDVLYLERNIDTELRFEGFDQLTGQERDQSLLRTYSVCGLHPETISQHSIRGEHVYNPDALELHSVTRMMVTFWLG